MRKFKEVASLSLAFAMVAGSLAVPTTAYADTTATNNVTESKVKVDYANGEVAVETTSSRAIYYSTNYKADKKDKAVWNPADYAYSTTQAGIQISPTKSEQKIYITDDKTATPYELKLNKQESGLLVGFSGNATTTKKAAVKMENDWTSLTALTAGYNAEGASKWAYGFLGASIKAGSDIKAISAQDAQDYLQYKIGTTGKWKSVTTLDVRKYAAKGTTLYFRIGAKDKNITTASGTALANLGFASKEVKVSYKKQANKPNVKIDGATKKISLSKTQEYRVSGSTEWIKVADVHLNENKKLNTIYLKDLHTSTSAAWTYSEAASNQRIEVRTAATDKAIASKISVIELNAVPVPSVSSASGISFAPAKETSFDKGIKVTNASTGSAFQVAVATVSGSTITTEASKLKWKNVAAVKNGTKKTITITKKDLDKGNALVYRTAL